MPRRKMSDAEKKAVSRRMKARWRAAKAAAVEPSANGTRVEARLIVHIQEASHDLTMEEATTLHDALHKVIFTEPRHD